MEEQLRDASAFDPESLSGAVNLANVGITDTPEQREALQSIETLLALVEGWVDCAVWRAGMAHLPHLDQLREMMRRERAVGGPAELTFENLLGLQLRPKRVREAAAQWERITNEQGLEARDAMWGHPDMLPALPSDDTDADTTGAVEEEPRKGSSIDWDAELSKLLDDDGAGDGQAEGDDAQENGDSTAGDAHDDGSDASEPGHQA